MLALATIAAAALGILIIRILFGTDFATWLPHTLMTLQNLDRFPLMTVAAFALANTGAAVLLLPCAMFSIAAGALWGALGGTVIASVSTAVASTTTLVLGRYATRLLAPLLRRIPQRVRMAVPKGLSAQRLLILLNLNPLVPSASVGYLFAPTKLAIVRFAWLSMLSNLPLQIAMVNLGAALRGGVLAANSELFRPFLALGIAIALFTLLVVARATIRRTYEGDKPR